MNMKIELRERQNHRFIYVNPANNTVHLIMPIVGGQTIATDNTCQTLAALNHFFGAQPLSSQTSALCELTEYKKELEHDIALIEDGPLKEGKRERLAQIELYIELVASVLAHPEIRSLGGFAGQYPQPLQVLLQQPNRNLFSMRLRPRHIDNFRSTVAPTFSVDPHTATGLYSALHTQFASINGIPVVTPTERLVQAVMAAVPAADRQPPFNDAKIRRMAIICAQQAQLLFSQDMDFQQYAPGAAIDLAYLTNILIIPEDPTQHTVAYLPDIVNGIIQSAVSNLDTQIAASPFHVSHIETDEAKERLSIITQFFLAQINIYCVAKSLTLPGVNFGTILDGNVALSRGVAVCVATSLANNQPVEDALLDFVANTPAFQLRAGANTFTAVRRQEIKQRFNSQYTTIQGSPHFDEFMVLEQTRRGPFTEHQGAICVDFEDLVKELRIQPRDTATWSLRHTDTFGLNPEGLAILPHQNRQIEVVCVELTAAELNARIQGYLGQTATLDTLAEFLLADVITVPHARPGAAAAPVETRQKLFATLDKQTIDSIKSSPHWGPLRTLITAKTSQELRLAFEQQFHCVDVDVVLTEQMLHALYIQVIRDSEPTPELCNMTYIGQSHLEQHILPILRRTYPALAQQSRIKRSSNPPYSLVLECPTPEYAHAITTIARENTGFMYVSPQIARAVYLEATERFGEGWDTVGGRRLDNARGPSKLTHALNLLAIPSGDATFPGRGQSRQGYVLRAPHDSIQRLQQLSYSRPQFIISPQLESQLYAYAETRAENRQALAGLNGVEKLAEAFRISGLDCSQIHPHLDKVSYWVQLTPGGMENWLGNSAFQHIERTNGQSPLANILDGFGSRGRARFRNHPAFQLLAPNDPARSRGRPAPAFGIASAAPVASLEALRHLVREAINHRVPAGPECPARGSWAAFDESGWEYGVSGRSGARSVANVDYQISILADGTRLEVRDKHSGFTEITDAGRLQEVFRTFMAQAQPLLARWSSLLDGQADLPPIQQARLLLADYIGNTMAGRDDRLFQAARPEHSETIQGYIAQIDSNTIASVPELLMYLQSYRDGNITQGRWNAEDALARLIAFIETGLEQYAAPRAGGSISL